MSKHVSFYWEIVNKSPSEEPRPPLATGRASYPPPLQIPGYASD